MALSEGQQAVIARTRACLSIKKTAQTCTTARTGAITLIQRFGSALNLNTHFPMLLLDGVYANAPQGNLLRRAIIRGHSVLETTAATPEGNEISRSTRRRRAAVIGCD